MSNLIHKKDQGKLGEALVIAQCLQHGVEVFTDFGDNSKIDLIINQQGKLYKIQVKCAGREKRSPGVAKLYLTKSGPNYQFKYDITDVDYFAVVDYSSCRIAWVKLTKDLMKKSTLHLRIDPINNLKNSSIKWFSDFEDFPFKDG